MTKGLWRIATASAALVACHAAPSASTFGASDAVGADAGARDPRYTFTPASYSRDCESADDCIIVSPLANCYSCCGEVALRRGDAERDLAAVEAACREPGAPPGSGCLMACAPHRAACFEHACVMMLTDGGTP